MLLTERSAHSGSSGDNSDPWEGRPGVGGLDNLRRFVHQWFNWLDRSVPVDRLVAHLATNNLHMQLPEGKISSYREFRGWYSAFTARYRRVRHELHEVIVAWDRDDGYTVELWGRRYTESNIDGLSRIDTFRQRWRVRVSGTSTLEIERCEVQMLG